MSGGERAIVAAMAISGLLIGVGAGFLLWYTAARPVLPRAVNLAVPRVVQSQLATMDPSVRSLLEVVGIDTFARVAGGALEVALQENLPTVGG